MHVDIAIMIMMLMTKMMMVVNSCWLGLLVTVALLQLLT